MNNQKSKIISSHERYPVGSTEITSMSVDYCYFQLLLPYPHMPTLTWKKNAQAQAFGVMSETSGLGGGELNVSHSLKPT